MSVASNPSTGLNVDELLVGSQSIHTPNCPPRDLSIPKYVNEIAGAIISDNVSAFKLQESPAGDRN